MDPDDNKIFLIEGINLETEITNKEDFLKLLKWKVEFARARFLRAVKEEYFSKLFIKVNSLKNNNPDLYKKHYSFIKKTLRQTSLKGMVVIFKESGIVYNSNRIIYFNLPDPKDYKNSFWHIQYFKGFGTSQSWQNKVLHPLSDFVLISTERYYRNKILGDISIMHPADTYWLSVLMEQAKTLYIESWKSKGVLEITYLDKMDVPISEVYDAFEYGFLQTQAEVNPSGKNSWDEYKDNSSPFKNGRINNVQFNSAKEIKDMFMLVKEGVDNLFKSKGLISADNQKEGVYNEHSQETEGKDQERNEALIDVVEVFNKNISAILTFLEGREIMFEFIFEKETIKLDGVDPNAN